MKNRRPPYWKSTFDFEHLPEICTLFCIRLPNFFQIVISISQDGGLNTTSGFVSVDVTPSLPSLLLLANQILSSYLKWRLRYFLWQSKMAWEGVRFFFKIKNVLISWDALLHFMNTKMYFDACRLSLHNSTPSHCSKLTIKDSTRRLYC